MCVCVCVCVCVCITYESRKVSEEIESGYRNKQTDVTKPSGRGITVDKINQLSPSSPTI